MQEQERVQRKAKADAHAKFMKAEAKRIAADNAAEQRDRAARAAEDRKRKADSQVHMYRCRWCIHQLYFPQLEHPCVAAALHKGLHALLVQGMAWVVSNCV